MNPDEPLTSKVALITGATGGIGAATCRLLASQGCSIGIHYNSDSATASSLHSELCAKYPDQQFVTVQADMSDYSAVRALHATIVNKLGHPEILINNAGSTGGKSGVKGVEDVSIEVFEETWRVNCGSSFLLTQLCVPSMKQREYGRVICVSSVAGITGGIIGPHYASAKSALHGMIHWLANAYAKQGITVNGIAPALIQDTKMLPGSSEELAKKIPIGRLGTPDEIADTIAWIINTSYVTNKVIAVDGGMFPQH